jgi:uncharacterized protein YjbI with pentapeptide repeats
MALIALSTAQLQGADFRNAQLQGADFRNAQCQEADSFWIFTFIFFNNFLHFFIPRII